MLLIIKLAQLIVKKNILLFFSVFFFLKGIYCQDTPQLVNSMSHTDGVLLLASSPTENYIASLGSENNLIVWERETQKKVKSIKTKEECSEVLFLSDSLLALFSFNKITLVDIKNNKDTSYTLNFGTLKDVAFCGNKFISLSENGDLMKFNSDFKDLNIISDKIKSIDVSEGSVYFLNDQNQVFVSRNDFSEYYLLASLTSTIDIVSFKILDLKNGMILSLANGDVVFFNKNSGNYKIVFNSSGKISSLVLNKDMTKLIIPTEGYSCVLLELSDFTNQVLYFKDYMTSALAFNDGFWVSSWDGNIYSINEDFRIENKIGDEALKISCYEFIDSNSVAVGFNNGRVKIISENGFSQLAEPRNPQILPLVFSSSISSLKYCEGKSFLSVTDYNGNWIVYDLEKNVQVSQVKFDHEIYSQGIAEKENAILIVTAREIFLYDYNFKLLSSTAAKDPWFVNFHDGIFTVNDLNGFHIISAIDGKMNFVNTRSVFKDDKYICDVKYIGDENYLFLTYDGFLGLQKHSGIEIVYDLGQTVNLLYKSQWNNSVYVITQENELVKLTLSEDNEISDFKKVKFESPNNSTWALHEIDKNKLLLSSGSRIYQLDSVLQTVKILKDFESGVVSSADSRFSFNLSKNNFSLFAMLETGLFDFQILERNSLADSICISCLYQVQNAKQTLRIDNSFHLVSDYDYPIRFSTDRGFIFDFYIFKTGEWLVYDKEYHFDGSGKSMEKLYFNCGLEIIELSQVKDAMYVPGLAKMIVAGEDINYKGINDIDICGSLPLVQLLSENKENWNFKLKCRLWPINRVELKIDGKLIKTIDLKERLRENQEINIVIDKKEVQDHFVPGMSNKLSLSSICINQNSEYKSRAIDIEVLAEGEKKVPNLYMLLVGVNEYKDPTMNLQFPVKDARAFGKALSCSAEQLLGKERVFVYNVQNTIGSEKVFTTPEREGVIKALREISQKASTSDILLIFFAGHGVMHGSDDSFTFLTSDASRTNRIGVSTKDLALWLNPEGPFCMKPNKTILIYDACNSGQAAKDLFATLSRDDDETERLRQISDLGDKSGLFILAASAPNQSAYETPSIGNGLLTYSLLYTLKNNLNILDYDNSGDGFLNLQKWFLETEKEQNRVASSYGLKQQAQPFGSSNIRIGKVDDDVRDCIPLVQDKPKVFFGSARDSTESDPLELKSKLNKRLSLVDPYETELSFLCGGTESFNNYTIRLIYEVQKERVKCKILFFNANRKLKELNLESNKNFIEESILNEVNKFFN
jgi:hypothetical protein